MTLSFGDFELSAESYELRRAGESVRVEPRVFEVLAYLVAHRDRVVSKEELLEKLWPDRFVSESALTRALAQLADDRDLHAHHARTGRENVARDFTAEIMAEQTWTLYSQLTGRT